MVGTLKPYLVQKNLFELIELKGSGEAKPLGTSTLASTLALAPESPFDTFTT